MFDQVTNIDTKPVTQTALISSTRVLGSPGRDLALRERPRCSVRMRAIVPSGRTKSMFERNIRVRQSHIVTMSTAPKSNSMPWFFQAWSVGTSAPEHVSRRVWRASMVKTWRASSVTTVTLSPASARTGPVACNTSNKRKKHGQSRGVRAANQRGGMRLMRAIHQWELGQVSLGQANFRLPSAPSGPSTEANENRFHRGAIRLMP